MRQEFVYSTPDCTSRQGSLCTFLKSQYETVFMTRGKDNGHFSRLPAKSPRLAPGLAITVAIVVPVPPPSGATQTPLFAADRTLLIS